MDGRSLHAVAMVDLTVTGFFVYCKLEEREGMERRERGARGRGRERGEGHKEKERGGEEKGGRGRRGRERERVYS